jgi:hypothetical protein
MSFLFVNSFASIGAANADVFAADLQYLIHQAAAVQGDAAFDCPRSAALAHEAAHAVVYTAMGISVKSARVRMRDGQATGETLANGPRWMINEKTSTAHDFKIACAQISGLLGEALFDSANFRAGSSLDEIVLTRQIGAGIGWKSEEPFESVLTTIFGTVAEILYQNADVVRSIVSELDHHRIVRGRRLTHLLAPVKPWKAAS